MRLIETLCSYAIAGTVFVLAISGPVQAQCVGDCDENGSVAINELIRGVNILLGNADRSTCAAMDSNGNGSVAVNEVIQAVNNSLNGCPAVMCGDCNDGDPCTEALCVDGECVNPPVECQDDGNECTAESCDPVGGCVSDNVDDGTSCNSGGGSCQSGACVDTPECVGDPDCDDSNACTDDSCEGTSCVNTDVVCADDGNECTAETCDAATGCSSSNVADGTSCDGGAGSCQGGTCTAGTIEYQQDFEALDQMSGTALGDDGWLVFGNVFNGETGAYLYGYGSFAAPNGDPPGFSQIDIGQGGAEQGDQQLSIYNDYNNTDHANGHQIESNVFRERRITADDVGKTITFSFDAKRGNINDPSDPLCPCTSTAIAFIKTLNPAAGFATTNFIQQETTAIPDTWGGYTLTLAIDSSLVNQLLQVGFSTTATLYQPSGVFYDNIQVGSSPTT